MKIEKKIKKPLVLPARATCAPSRAPYVPLILSDYEVIVSKDGVSDYEVIVSKDGVSDYEVIVAKV